MTVHNHGPAEGPGLDCPETRSTDGRLTGACMFSQGWEESGELAPEKQRWTFSHRYSTSRADYFVWLWMDSRGVPLDAWAMPVAALLGKAHP